MDSKGQPADLVAVERGEVIGIGKLKIFPTNAFPYEIPILSFMVIKTDSDSYVSTCIQLQLDGYGENPDRAKENMKENCANFLRENFTDPRAREKCWDNLQELFAMSPQELWRPYRRIQLDLAEQGVSTDITSVLIDRIADLERQVAVVKAVKEKAAAGGDSFEAEFIEYRQTA
jgi:hypothetical protein